MKKILALLLLAVFVTTVPVVASDVTTAVYDGVITITSTDSDEVDNVVVTVNLNTSGLITAGFLNTLAQYYAAQKAGADVPFMLPPGDSTTAVLFLSSIAAHGTDTATFYTGQSDMGYSSVYFPGSTGMSTPDHATLEPGTNPWQYYWRGYVTGGQTILYKDEALAIWAGTDNISFGPVSSTQWLRGTIASAVSWASPNNAVDGSVATPAAYTFPGGSPVASNPLDTTHAAANVSGVRYYADGVYDNIAVSLNIGGVWTQVYNGTGAGSGWNTVSYAAENVTGERVVITENSNSNRSLYELQYYNTAVTNPTFTAKTTVTGLVPSEHIVIASSNSTHIALSVDGVSGNVTTWASGFTDNANTWQVCSSATPYMYSQNITVNGVVKQSIDWEYDTAAPYQFTDDSGNGNHAIPTFRTTGSDSDVSANLTSFQAVSPASVSGTAAMTWPVIVTSTPETPSNMYTSTNRPGFIGEPVIHSLLTLANIPESWFWYNLAMMLTMLASMGIYSMFASKQIEALLLKVIVTTVLLVFFSLPGINIWGFYVPFYYMLFGFGLIVARKDFGW